MGIKGPKQRGPSEPTLALLSFIFRGTQATKLGVTSMVILFNLVLPQKAQIGQTEKKMGCEKRKN